MTRLMERARRAAGACRSVRALAAALLLVVLLPLVASAQQGGWTPVDPAPAPAATPAPAPAPKSQPPAAAARAGDVTLSVLLTPESPPIEQGLQWRIFEARVGADGKPRLVATSKDGKARLKLPAGDYLVHVAYGRAHHSRRISVKAGEAIDEQLVLNAGGFKLTALLASGEPVPERAVSFDIFLADERDQLGSRIKVISAARPGVIFRLNAGFYHVVSTYGDANAVVLADVTVEAGKLTEATVTHQAARVTFRLVERTGGEALADTEWTIMTAQGEVVKKSFGGLPSHILAVGTYFVLAKNAGQSYRRDFAIEGGDAVQVEVVMR